MTFLFGLSITMQLNELENICSSNDSGNMETDEYD